MEKLVSFNILLSVFVRLELVHLQTQENRPAVRVKRVIAGLEGLERDRDHYNVFRYFVFLSRSQPNWISRQLGIGLNPSLDDLACGGSLLTPSIVQTAGHCIAKANEVPGITINPLVTNNVWENPLYSYVGNNVVLKMTEWLEPDLYAVPSWSASIRTGRIWTGDIGFIVTKQKITDEAPLAEISYAPVYPQDSIIQFYHDAVSKEYMCLQVGHGLWNLLYGEYEDGEYMYYPDDRISNPIRWGWRTVMNELDCEYQVLPVHRRDPPVYNYSQQKTWVCSQGMKHRARYDDYKHHAGPGDSGGPWTCNNIYFASITGGATPRAEHICSTAFPIVYTLFENSAETRDAFIDHWNHVQLMTRARVDDELSQSPPKLFVHYLLILTIIIWCL